MDILEKGKGASILCDGKEIIYSSDITCCVCAVVTTDENDQVICKNQFSVFVIGMTGFGGKRKSSLEKVCLCVCMYTCIHLQRINDLSPPPSPSLLEPLPTDLQILSCKQRHWIHR